MNKKSTKNIILFFISFFILICANAQTPNGPGGVLNTSGGATSLSLWLDANNSVTGTSVTSWNDLSGHANNATPLAIINRPTLTASAINGLPVVRFDGANTYLDAGTNASLDMTQWSFFMVAKANVNKDYNYFFGKGNDASENYEFLAYAAPYMHSPILFTTGARTFTNTANSGAMITE